MGLQVKWRTNTHRRRDVRGEERREVGREGSYGEQSSQVIGLDEDLL
jgi:hypothetical protein